jgi:hypothetical protein
MRLLPHVEQWESRASLQGSEVALLLIITNTRAQCLFARGMACGCEDCELGRQVGPMLSSLAIVCF